MLADMTEGCCLPATAKPSEILMHIALMDGEWCYAPTLSIKGINAHGVEHKLSYNQ